jgi:hypothetical protein
MVMFPREFVGNPENDPFRIGFIKERYFSPCFLIFSIRWKDLLLYHTVTGIDVLYSYDEVPCMILGRTPLLVSPLHGNLPADRILEVSNALSSVSSLASSVALHWNFGVVVRLYSTTKKLNLNSV